MMTLKSDKHVQARLNAAMLHIQGLFFLCILIAQAFNPRNSSDNIHCASRQEKKAGTLTKGCFSKKAYFLFMPSINS